MEDNLASMPLQQVCRFALYALLCALPLHGQAIPQDEIRITSRPYTLPTTNLLRVQANLVEVGVVVRDRAGRPVANLRQSNFQVFDNGKPQTITAFSAEGSSSGARSAAAPAASTPANDAGPSVAQAAQPRFAALFFDDQNMQLGDVVAARKAAQAFIEEGGLEHSDRVGVFTSSRSVTLEFTDDPKKLADSLAQLRPHTRKADEGPAACPPVMPYQAHLIMNVHDDQALDLAIAQGVAALCLAGLSRPDQVLMVQRRADQVLSVAEEFAQDTLGSLGQVIAHLGQMPGRRVLVLVSAGFLSNTLQSQEDRLVENALRTGIVINSLDAKGLATEVATGELQRPTGRLRGDQIAYAEILRSQQREAFNDVMASLSRDTGGTFFHNNNDLGRGLRDTLAVEARYVLGFSPRDLKPDGRFHNLKVKLASPGGFAIDARRGYFAPAKIQQAKATASGAFDSAVLTGNEIMDFPAEATTQLERLGSGEPVLRVAIHIDFRHLPFQHRAGRNVERLRLVTALFDTEGKFLLGTEAIIDLALKDATLAQLSSQGFTQKLSLRAPAGAYNLREVVQESIQGRIAAVSQPVQVP